MPDEQPKSVPEITAHRPVSRSEGLLVGTYLSYLLPRLQTDRSAPKWPPDIFGLCMALLCKAGAYCRILENWPPDGGGTGIASANWSEWIAERGIEWRTLWPDSPPFIAERWKTISASWDNPVEEIAGKLPLAHALLELCALADEASEGFWLPGSPGTPGTRTTTVDLNFYVRAEFLRKNSGVAATLCEEIHPSRLCVLPKCRTPQNGLTSRSLSHHLAVCSADEIKPQWVMGPYGNADELSLNLLLVPWPEVVTPRQFGATAPTPTEMRNMPPNFGFFGYQHNDKTPENVVRVVEDLHSTAVAKMGRIDGVVLPEAALSPVQHQLLSEAVLRREAFLVSGVGEPSSDIMHGQNFLYVDLPTIKPLMQHKHHRWMLDQPQISQYGLGSRLYPEKAWWEHISVSDRKLNFIAVLPWLVMSVLICEDLARPDPVGDLVRAVGPNLVIALLMDGPQLKERWGARYATTLADDPGSSVLTVTSSGMCSLSRPPAGVQARRIVALWKDAKSPAPVEIEMPIGSQGVVISLSVRRLEEWTADGRGDKRNAGYPMLSGIHPISVTSK
jgi:hypothetical protein